ncbi:MAG: FKBP-type peptidyl-prolyl cis-trans isomerase [Chitinophagaceae bacterium]|nr:FKBP-type peptidyl-prolyl cis-trans isomerase [Chitinophagaceae bacterium]
MRTIAIFALIISLSATSFGQAKPAAKKPAAKPAGTVQAPVMKNALDSFSYALGLSMANFYKEQGIENINLTLVNKALNDVKAGKPKFDEAQINNAIMSYMQTAKSAKAAGEKKLSQAFLDSTKQLPGVVTLPSGLQYKVITEGTGPKPGPSDKVKVHYHGKLRTGKVFDSSVERGQPIELSVNGVIPGWTEALQLMPVGSKWTLYIPSDLGYGDNGAGADIKPGSALVFDVELLEIVK